MLSRKLPARHYWHHFSGYGQKPLLLCRDKPDAIAHRYEDSPPEMRSGVNLHSNKSSRFKLSDSIQQFRTRDFFVPCDEAIDHPDTDLKNWFGDINTNNTARTHVIQTQTLKVWHWLFQERASITLLQISIFLQTTSPKGGPVLTCFRANAICSSI